MLAASWAEAWLRVRLRYWRRIFEFPVVSGFLCFYHSWWALYSPCLQPCKLASAGEKSGQAQMKSSSRLQGILSKIASVAIILQSSQTVLRNAWIALSNVTWTLLGLASGPWKLRDGGEDGKGPHKPVGAGQLNQRLLPLSAFLVK